MTYTLGPLPDDPSKERLLVEVIDNPAGSEVQVLRAERIAADRRTSKAEWMRKHRAEQRRPAQPIACSHCGATFTPKRSTAQFCSTRCRVAAHRATS